MHRPSQGSRKSQASHTSRPGNCRPNPIPAPNVQNLRPLVVRNSIGRASGPDNRSKVADVMIMNTLPELDHSFFNTPELISGIPKKHRIAIRKDSYYYLPWQQLCKDLGNRERIPIFASLTTRLPLNPTPLIQLTNLYAADGNYQSAFEVGEKLLTFDSEALKLALIGKSIDPARSASVQK
jgi:hypothetical protein